jgi:antitoxin component YwqK of YwqJK toxin-antitoxin module
MCEYIEEYFTEKEIPELFIETYSKYKINKLCKSKGLLVNGKKEGKWIEGYFNKNYYYYKEINYFDNIKHGECKKYYKNGDIYSKCNYFNGKKEGKCYIFWTDLHP